MTAGDGGVDWVAMVDKPGVNFGARTITKTDSGHNIYICNPKLVIDAGRRDAADHPDDDPSAALVGVTTRGSFEPTLQRRGDDVEVLLHSCPFANVAVADPDIVCELRHGIAIGVAEQFGGITIDGPDGRDPRGAPADSELTSMPTRPPTTSPPTTSPPTTSPPTTDEVRNRR